MGIGRRRRAGGSALWAGVRVRVWVFRVRTHFVERALRSTSREEGSTQGWEGMFVAN